MYTPSTHTCIYITMYICTQYTPVVKEVHNFAARSCLMAEHTVSIALRIFGFHHKQWASGLKDFTFVIYSFRCSEALIGC